MAFDSACNLEANFSPAIEFRLAPAIGLLELTVGLVAVEEAVDRGSRLEGRSSREN